MRIGLFGGTFNPIHMGHMVLAEECWYKLTLDKVIFIPAYIPPHKEVEGDVCASDRLNMVRLAVGVSDRFEISSYEMDKREKGYSIDTIGYFKQKYPKDTEFFFLTGADAAEALDTWKNIDDILRGVTFVVVTRAGWSKKCPYEDKIKRVSIQDVNVSSTLIRQKIRKHEPIDFLLPKAVVEYIRNKGLYR